MTYDTTWRSTPRTHYGDCHIANIPPWERKAELLTAQGYCRVGKTDLIARIDRPDWEAALDHYLAKKPWSDESVRHCREHYYRKHLSTDTMRVDSDVARLMPPSHMSEPGYVHCEKFPQPKTPKGTGMNLHTMAALVRDDITTIHVSFNSGRDTRYAFLCPLAVAETLSEGDFVLVENSRAGMPVIVGQVGAVHEEPICDPEDGIDYKWAFAKVDLDALTREQAIQDQLEDKLKNRRKRSRREQALAALGIADPSEFVKQIAHSVDQNKQQG